MSTISSNAIDPIFRAYQQTDRSECLALFDANCPLYFAPNERGDYEIFLDARPQNYKVCSVAHALVGAFGVYRVDERNAALHWILLSPSIQGRGVGSAIMANAISETTRGGQSILHISASHKSAAFFAKFGAIVLSQIPDGWGPGMHRVEMQLCL